METKNKWMKNDVSIVIISAETLEFSSKFNKKWGRATSFEYLEGCAQKREKSREDCNVEAKSALVNVSILTSLILGRRRCSVWKHICQGSGCNTVRKWNYFMPFALYFTTFNLHTGSKNTRTFRIWGLFFLQTMFLLSTFLRTLATKRWILSQGQN